MAARFALVALALFAFAAVASAQTLQTLHVRSFVLTASNDSPAVEEPFSITLTIHVNEPLAHLDNVYLPTFVGAEELGDLRSTASGPQGTTYKETLELVAHAAGELDIQPAYLDAIDARTHKPTRYASNPLRIMVRGPVAQTAQTLRTIAAAIAGISALALLAIVLLLRRRPRTDPQPPVPAEPEPVETPPLADPQVDRLQLALQQLRDRRDRSSVMQLRAELWNEVGAVDGQTIADVLQLPHAHDARTHRMLLAVERAAFIDDEKLQNAIDEVLQ